MATFKIKNILHKICRFLIITHFFLLTPLLNPIFAAEKNSRNYINIVGSSTVYPFAATIAERFGKKKNHRTPTVESTGTGGGFKLFCSGIGYQFPDFANASRQIQKSEIEKCASNGIRKIGEIKIGYDGIVLANSINGKKVNFTKDQIFLALANKVPRNGKLVDNFYTKWSQIDKSLPDSAIRVYGPPPTSGTRDAFVELMMEDFCINNAVFAQTFADKKIRQKQCHTIRSDGAFIEAGENDNLILQKLKNDKEAFGIFGFSFLSENKNMIKAAKINMVEPEINTILSGKYSVSRPLFIYYKEEHFILVPAIKDFIREIVSLDTLGRDGYLAQKGLVPLSDLETKKLRDEVLKGV